MSINVTSAFTLLLGATTGLGLFMLASVRLWPRPEPLPERSRDSAFVLRIRSNAGVLGLSPAVFVSLHIALAFLGALIIYGLTGVVALAVISAVALGSLPGVLSSLRRSHSEHALRLMWPDVVDGIIASLRSGSNIPEAISNLATHHETRIANPARAFSREFQLTSNFDKSLDQLKLRWAAAPADRIIETLRLARELGSSETIAVLMALGSHLRSDSAVRQELEARQGWIKIAARIGLVAPWIVLLLLSSRPEAAAAYNTSTGVVVIALGAIVSLFAYRIMTGIGRLRQEERWLA